MNTRVPVHICATDPISRAGVTSALRARPEVLLIDEDEVDASAVGIVVADATDDEALRLLRMLAVRGCRRTVLVATVLDDAGLLPAVEAGVCALLRRSEATPERLAHAAVKAAGGEGMLPPDLLGRLLSQVSRLQRHVLAPRGLSVSGISTREAQVLRLVADGMDTREIATELSYSERTVKNVLHDITNRFQLRNRSHAVAYAMREGMI